MVVMPFLLINYGGTSGWSMVVNISLFFLCIHCLTSPFLVFAYFPSSFVPHLFVFCFCVQKRPGSPKQQNEKSNSKPPLPVNIASQFRKGAYHESLDFVMSLCDTSYGLVDIFPVEDRKPALREVV